LQADNQLLEGKFNQAALSYQQAAEIIAHRWPLIADAFLLASSHAAQRAGSEQNDQRMANAVANMQLEAAGRLNEAALDTAIHAAEVFRRGGENQMGKEQLERALAILRRIEPQVDSKSDPARYAALQTGIASTLWRLGQRLAEIDLLLQAETAADKALTTAETLDAPTALAGVLIDWGNIQLALGQRIGNADRIDKAISAYQRASGMIDDNNELRAWLTTRNNIAAAYFAKSYVKDDPQILSQSAETHRDTLRRLDRDKHADLWALVKSNLGRVLLSQGRQENSARLLRMAAQELEATLSYYTHQTAPLAWAQTSQDLAEVWSEIGIMEKDEKALQQAVAVIESTIQALDRQTTPYPWAVAHFDLGNILYALGELAPKADNNYEAAAAAYENAANVITEKVQPQFAATVILYRASALYRAALESGNTETRKEAENVANEAVRISSALNESAPSEQTKDLAKDAIQLLQLIKK
jgi:tetratricopeptide (TPR) repeat protein